MAAKEIELLKFVMEHSKEIGGSSAAFILTVGLFYHKYVKKQIENIYDKIKDEQQADSRGFQSVDRKLSEFKNKLEAHEEAFKIVENQLKHIRTEVGDQKRGMDAMLADLRSHEAYFQEHSHKLDLNSRDITLLQGLFKDALTDVKEMQSRSQNLELSFAKVLGALSGKIE